MSHPLQMRREFKPDLQKQLRALTLLLEATPLANASQKHADGDEERLPFGPPKRPMEERNPSL